ncbi:hypothetical protein ABNQ39_07135 [Azospirillum sp. A26]|uniref:hypothetical protein n=1 Tax=Azospirillum sp. A26 TaxID=3160607 RepID=UPI00366ACEB5
MNLRILKKLSKRAAPLLAHFDIELHRLLLAEKGDSYTGLLIKDRTCWDRGRSVHDEVGLHEIKHPARDGNGWVYMRPPSHPLKGTPMVGRTVGYEEPEWEERTALEELMECIRWSDKPATMTDAEWALAQRITGVTPITQDEIDGMLDDMDDETSWDFGQMDEELSL